jgi:hypothetical protein
MCSTKGGSAHVISRGKVLLMSKYIVVVTQGSLANVHIPPGDEGNASTWRGRFYTLHSSAYHNVLHSKYYLADQCFTFII